MGLDTTHDAWHGAYSSFGDWRNQLAELAGYEVTANPGSRWGLKSATVVHEGLRDGTWTAANLNGGPDFIGRLFLYTIEPEEDSGV